MKLFGTAGIRGPIDSKVTPELALNVGKALGTYIQEGTVVVGRDVRTSSVMLENAIVSGLLSVGVDVIRLGLVPTPMLAWATNRLGNAGVMITASHNPPADNGIKVFNDRGIEFFLEEEEKLEEIIFSQSYKKAKWDEIGYVVDRDLKNDYINAILDYVNHETELKVLLDMGNGAGSLITPYLLRKMGAKVITLNAQPDGHFPGRKSEPRYENIAYLSNLVRELGMDLAIAQDGDADRIAVFDEKGNYIEEDTLIALFAKLYVEENGGGNVVTSINTSFRIDKVVEEAGGKVYRVPLGQLHDGIKKYGAVFASEPWKFIHPKFGLWIDSFVTIGLLAKIIDKEGKPLSEIIKDIPKYYLIKKNVKCPDEVKSKVMERVKEKLQEKLADEVEEVLTMSGIRLNLKDGSWVLVRPSGTEPKIRVVVEGTTEKRRKELFDMAHTLVVKTVSSLSS
ncbi:phosphopentomutase [Palaeococcus pacificus DY20341]|uniref:Phosphopentomutase n=1 Tax=Palaeococcus pacificus DY20341 TaxID=1343739 RepID=A0A075LTX3_9EURY|nr:phosphoglucosamine mutase [Palaeococcus pacificus]AIF69417.1 phosphopentomutase [Palaeococcus pacificus DY20341]